MQRDNVCELVGGGAFAWAWGVGRVRARVAWACTCASWARRGRVGERRCACACGGYVVTVTYFPPFSNSRTVQISTHAGISGLIGAGKTTLATALAKELDLPVYYEPVSQV